MNVKYNDGEYQLSDDSGRIIVFREADRPEVYSIFLDLAPGGANKNGVEFINMAVDYMFAETPALLLFGYIEKKNMASRQVASQCRWASNPSKDTEDRVYKYITAGAHNRHRPNEKIAAKRRQGK